MILDRYYYVKQVTYQIKINFVLSRSLRKTIKIFLNDRFRVYFKSAVEQISLEFAKFKSNENNH